MWKVGGVGGELGVGGRGGYGEENASSVWTGAHSARYSQFFLRFCSPDLFAHLI